MQSSLQCAYPRQSIGRRFWNELTLEVAVVGHQYVGLRATPYGQPQSLFRADWGVGVKIVFSDVVDGHRFWRDAVQRSVEPSHRPINSPGIAHRYNVHSPQLDYLGGQFHAGGLNVDDSKEQLVSPARPNSTVSDLAFGPSAAVHTSRRNLGPLSVRTKARERSIVVKVAIEIK